MAKIIVWGKTREMLSGDLPPGLTVEQVDTFAALQAEADAAGALVLVDRSHLESEGAALEAWLKGGAHLRALVVGVADAEQTDEVLRRWPFLDDLMVRPVTRSRLRLRLDRGLEALNSRRVIQQLDEALVRKSQELHELNKIGVALSAQRDIGKLLELILAKSREITAADAGSLYLVKRGKEEDSQTDDLLS